MKKISFNTLVNYIKENDIYAFQMDDVVGYITTPPYGEFIGLYDNKFTKSTMVKFEKKDNEIVTVSRSSLFLVDTDGNETQIAMLKEVPFEDEL